MKKGFVISVDALLAVVVLFTLLTLSFDALKQDGSDWQVTHSLQRTAHYAGESLEVSGALSAAVGLNDTTRLRAFLDGLPNNTCASVSVKNNPDANQSLFTVSKSGCSSVLGESIRVSRGFMYVSPPDANLYVATLSMWLNRED